MTNAPPSAAPRECIAAPAVTCPLTSFQRAMLTWERLHPYNAVHALCLRATPDIDRLAAAIRAVGTRVGIGELEVAPDERSLRYAPLRAVNVASGVELAAAAEAGLNAAFDTRPGSPFLWSVAGAADGAAHWLVLAYRHVAADAHAIQAFLAAVVNEYLALAAPPAPLTIEAPPAALALDPPLGAARLAAGLWRTLRVFRRMKRAHKMPDERDQGDATGVVLRRASAGLIDRLRARCRAAPAGLNDVLLAAFGAAIAARTPDRHTSRRRRKIALGSVMNLRRAAAAELSDYFGVCLGDMLVLLDEPDAGMDVLVPAVARQTRARKAQARAGVAASSTFFVRRVWPLFFIPHTRRSYRKLLPFCGGVSTFVAAPQRFGPAEAYIQRYVRACPCGPATPLLLGPTVWGDQLELSLVHRHSCMRADAAAALLADVEARLEQWSGGAAAVVSPPGGSALQQS